MLVKLGVELRLTLQDRIQPLDGRDRDPGDRVDHVRGQVLDVVERRELPPVVRGRERLELLQRLAPQVRPVDQEEGPSRSGELDQPVGDVRGRERLPGAGRHLDQRARAVIRQRLLEIPNRAGLRGPQAGVIKLGKAPQEVPERRLDPRRVAFAGPTGECLRPMEPKHLAAARVWIDRAREPRLKARRFVVERHEPLRLRAHPVRQPIPILRRLPLHPGQRLALLLSLDHTSRDPVHEQQVVGPAVRRFQHELTDRDATGGREVRLLPVLHHPARRSQHLVDPHARAGLRGQIREQFVGHACRQPSVTMRCIVAGPKGAHAGVAARQQELSRSIANRPAKSSVSSTGYGNRSSGESRRSRRGKGAGS